MAIPFKSPVPKHTYNSTKEKTAITRHFTKRQVPKSMNGRLLLASWNIANLGAQDRTPNAKKLIAHILKRFDLVAVQEVNDEFRTFASIVDMLGSKYDYIMSDTAGNDERLAFIYRNDKVTPTHLFGELALRPREYPKRTVKVRWTDNNGIDRVDTFKDHRFVPFDRNPFIGSFACGNFDFVLANVHLYFGKFQNSKKKAERRKYARRVLEIHALAKWADRRKNKPTTYDKDIILLGDMNVPSMDPHESTYKELVRYGWQPANYTTKTGGSNLGNDKTYDQMVFAPTIPQSRITGFGVFDFDKAVFKPLWDKLLSQMSKSDTIGLFNRHMKHHISDHRPLWVELDVN
ncbi:MAG: endonuclease/exonuclease/phosphatase family protein [Gammaproteobacteria bacterium]|nr:endonuclease/exonuclease/phosphatase family protein [Gammaproteobacteria bacterium]